MGKYMRKCKVIGEVTVMAPELPGGPGHHVGVKTRARTLAMAAADTARAMNFKKSKVVVEKGELGFCSNHHLRVMITPDLLISPATSDNNSGSYSSSRSSSVGVSDRCSGNNGSCDELGKSLIMRSSVDLEREGFKFEKKSSNFIFHRRNCELSSESNELESTARQTEGNSRRRSVGGAAEKMPTETEIEELFTDFEKEEEKRFSEKYNYDIAKDVPMEGRFDWIPMKQ